MVKQLQDKQRELRRTHHRCIDCGAKLNLVVCYPTRCSKHLKRASSYKRGLKDFRKRESYEGEQGDLK